MTDAEPAGPAPQRRGRRIAMTAEEVDAFLATERTCRVATVGPDGPHATPLWFVWTDGELWLYSLTRSRRWADLREDPRVGVVVDAGEEYLDLRGVELTGRAEVVGAAPRTGPVDGDPVPVTVEAAFASKYFGVEQMVHDGRHGWLRVRPTKLVSWDFRKLVG